jgi:hypothetical protein
MRKDFERQLRLDVPALDQIEFDPRSRHELEAILMALKHLYDSPVAMRAVLRLIAADVGNADLGCDGLAYWEILVLAAVRLGCDLDYDALADLATNHLKLRAVMGVGEWHTKKYPKSTVHDNVKKLKPETLRAISRVIVGLGHKLDPKAIERVRGDSFVVQTNIHYPTDASLIVDGVRSVLRLSSRLGSVLSLRTYQNWKMTLRSVKRIHRKIQKVAASKCDKADKIEKLKPIYDLLIAAASDIVLKALDFKEKTASIKIHKRRTQEQVDKITTDLTHFIGLTVYVTQLAERRVIHGETIPQNEKILSIFEPHTELINRGKLPFPIEFGHRVFVVEDQAGFINELEIMARGMTDDKVVVSVITELQKRVHYRIKVASFDKGFWSPANLQALEKVVKVVCLPKKGGLDAIAKRREYSKSFRQARRWHPGVESAIHALVVGNGLAVCRDRGEEGYERYVALGVLGRNLCTLGRILQAKARKEQPPLRRAA